MLRSCLDKENFKETLVVVALSQRHALLHDSRNVHTAYIGRVIGPGDYMSLVLPSRDSLYLNTAASFNEGWSISGRMTNSTPWSIQSEDCMGRDKDQS